MNHQIHHSFMLYYRLQEYTGWYLTCVVYIVSAVTAHGSHWETAH